MLKLFLFEKDTASAPFEEVPPAKHTEIPMPVEGGTVTIGRSRLATLRPSIHLDKISSIHCTIHRKDGNWFVVFNGLQDDLQNSGFRRSKNGIFNALGQKVDQIDLRKAGDKAWLVFPPGESLPEISIVAEQLPEAAPEIDFSRDTAAFDPDTYNRQSLENIQNEMKQIHWTLEQVRLEQCQQAELIDQLKEGQSQMARRTDELETKLNPLLALANQWESFIDQVKQNDQRHDDLLQAIAGRLRIVFIGLAVVAVVQVANPEDRKELSRKLIDALPLLLFSAVGFSSTDVLKGGKEKP